MFLPAAGKYFLFGVGHQPRRQKVVKDVRILLPGDQAVLKSFIRGVPRGTLPLPTISRKRFHSEPRKAIIER